MTDFIFWQERLHVTGPGSTANAVARLRALLATGRFGVQERLAGTLEGTRLRVRRVSALGQAGDVVEFEGSMRPHSGGTVIEGTLSYTRATKIQFVGLLLMGLGLLAIGALQELGGEPAGGELLGIGAFVTALMLFWIYSSGKMKYTQIQFIEAKLNEVVAV